MPEVEIPDEAAMLLVLNGHATVGVDGVLDLTTAGVKWLDDWLEAAMAKAQERHRADKQP